MPDTSALAALIVAAGALIIACAQLFQQLLATAYVIRKCDRIVTGGLTKGGSRQWHWRQFRFTVKYQAIVFALPIRHIHKSLGISSPIRVYRPSKEIYDRAMKTRSQRTSSQACWVFLVQDLALSRCLQPEDIGTREESADRIPDDLTVAPTRVDCMTVLLSCIAMGMQVFKYSPTTGEITLEGSAGSISSSIHPILGGLLHYTVFSNELDELASDVINISRHGRALRQQAGVWANAVFGRFRDRSSRPEMVGLQILMRRKIPILQENGWPGDDGSDTTGGAATFMAFGHVDVYEIVPPSVVRPWAAHFAEVIAKAHHVEVLKSMSEVNIGITSYTPVPCDPATCRTTLDFYGCSSPHLPSGVTTSLYLGQVLESNDPKASVMLQYQGLIECLSIKGNPEDLAADLRDPSSYCPTEVIWGLICLADSYIRQVYAVLPLSHRKRLFTWTDRIVATAVCTLSNVGAPSWGFASEYVKTWPQTFDAACTKVLDDFEKTEKLLDENNRSLRPIIRFCAECSILRSAYYTVMMRAANPLGPGLIEGGNIETALAYMA